MAATGHTSFRHTNMPWPELEALLGTVTKDAWRLVRIAHPPRQLRQVNAQAIAAERLRQSELRLLSMWLPRLLILSTSTLESTGLVTECPLLRAQFPMTQ